MRTVNEHHRFTVATGMQGYFCDPKSPWQRGNNENNNGLLRHYLPKRIDFRTLTLADLDIVAAKLTTGLDRPSHTGHHHEP